MGGGSDALVLKPVATELHPTTNTEMTAKAARALIGQKLGIARAPDKWLEMTSFASCPLVAHAWAVGRVHAISAVLFVVACGATNAEVTPGADGGPGGSSGGVGDGSLPCAVDKVLADNCRKCHSSPPQYGAPMPLVTLADLHAAAKSDPSRKVFELVPERIGNDQKPMPKTPNRD